MNNIHGIKDSANFTIIKKGAGMGKPLIYADYSTQSSNEWSADSVYAMSKSTRAIRWDYNKQSTLKATLEVFDLKWLSLLTGSDFVSGVTSTLKRDVLEVNATNKVTLKATPKTGSLSIFLLDTDNLSHLTEQTLGTPATNVNEYSVATGTEITFNATTAPEKTKVVCYYLADTTATAQKMVIKANAFPFNVEVYSDTMIRDTDGLDKFVQLHYLNCKAKGNFTIVRHVFTI